MNKTSIKQIIGKKAYWGENIFEASVYEKDGKKVIAIEIYNWLHQYDTHFIIENKKQLIWQSHQTGFNLLTGDLSSNVNKDVGTYSPMVDSFIESFKHDID